MVEMLESQATIKEERDKSQSLQNRIAELETSLSEMASRAEQQQQTISFLVSEKTTLTTSVERLQDVDSSK